MKPAGFTTFLKLVELPDHLRKTELKKKLKGGGGFQYWRPLQIVAPKAFLPAANIEALKTEIDKLSSGPQRTYNKNAFASFCQWTKGKVLKPAASLPVIDVPFGNSGLTVRMRPDVSFEIDGQLFSMSLWATTKPLLSVASLSVGLKFSSDAYTEREHTTHKHLILDTITNKLFREEDILPNSTSLLMQKIEAFRKDIESFGPSPSPSPDSPSEHPIP
jgi:hypothetical protein